MTDMNDLERQRLAALARYDVIDTPREPAFDEVAALAANYLDERPLPGDREAGVSDRLWVKLLRRESIGLSDLPVMDQAPAAWSNPE